LGHPFDLARGAFANRADGDRLNPTESGEFANTFRHPISAIANTVIATASAIGLMRESAS
jgi:hypothetical protein